MFCVFDKDLIIFFVSFGLTIILMFGSLGKVMEGAWAYVFLELYSLVNFLLYDFKFQIHKFLKL